MKDRIIPFSLIKEKFEEEKKEEKIEKERAYEAKCLFDKALYENDNEKAIKLSLDAYELDMEKYEYKMHAISLMDDDLRKNEYSLLLEEIDKIILSYDEDSLIKIYDKNEVNKDRYKKLKYLLSLELIKAFEYDKALKILESFKNDSYYFKAKHLILNIYLLKKEYKRVVNIFDRMGDDSISCLIPLSFAYLKLNMYKDFVYTIKKINFINEYFLPLLNEMDEKILEKRDLTYKIKTKNEVYFAFKYFYSLYKNDLEYTLEVNSLLDYSL